VPPGETSVSKLWLILGSLLLCAVAVVALWQADVVPTRGIDDLQVGGLYSVEAGDGSFAIAKVLAVEPTIVHVHVYKERFSVRVRDDTPAALILSSLRDSDSATSGHLASSPSAFFASRPFFIRQATVEPAELVGYYQWEAAGGRGVSP
jgi:hypothetical protein